MRCFTGVYFSLLPLPENAASDDFLLYIIFESENSTQPTKVYEWMKWESISNWNQQAYLVLAWDSLSQADVI